MFKICNRIRIVGFGVRVTQIQISYIRNLSPCFRVAGEAGSRGRPRPRRRLRRAELVREDFGVEARDKSREGLPGVRDRGGCFS